MVIWNIIFAQLAAAAAANMGKYEDSPPRLRQPLSEFMPAMLLSFTSMSLLLLLLKDTSSFLFSLPISLCLCRFLCLCLSLPLSLSASLLHFIILFLSPFRVNLLFFPDLLSLSFLSLAFLLSLFLFLVHYCNIQLSISFFVLSLINTFDLCFLLSPLFAVSLSLALSHSVSKLFPLSLALSLSLSLAHSLSHVQQEHAFVSRRSTSNYNFYSIINGARNNQRVVFALISFSKEVN